MRLAARIVGFIAALALFLAVAWLLLLPFVMDRCMPASQPLPDCALHARNQFALYITLTALIAMTAAWVTARSYLAGVLVLLAGGMIPFLVTWIAAQLGL